MQLSFGVDSGAPCGHKRYDFQLITGLNEQILFYRLCICLHIYTPYVNVAALTCNNGMATFPRKSALLSLSSSNTVTSNTEWMSFTLLRRQRQTRKC